MKGIVGGVLFGAGMWAFIFAAVFGSWKLLALGFTFIASGIVWALRMARGEGDG